MSHRPHINLTGEQENINWRGGTVLFRSGTIVLVKMGDSVKIGKTLLGDSVILWVCNLGDSVKIIIFALENKFVYDLQEETI